MTKQINILMTESAKGAVTGIYSMDFERGKNYRVDLPLAQCFFSMNVAAAIAGDTQNLNILNVDGNGKASWRIESSDE